MMQSKQQKATPQIPREFSFGCSFSVQISGDKKADFIRIGIRTYAPGVQRKTISAGKLLGSSNYDPDE